MDGRNAYGCAVIRNEASGLVGVGDSDRTRAQQPKGKEGRGARSSWSVREYSSSAMLRRIAVTCRTGAPYSFNPLPRNSTFRPILTSSHFQVLNRERYPISVLSPLCPLSPSPSPLSLSPHLAPPLVRRFPPFHVFPLYLLFPLLSLKLATTTTHYTDIRMYILRGRRSFYARRKRRDRENLPIFNTTLYHCRLVILCAFIFAMKRIERRGDIFDCFLVLT